MRNTITPWFSRRSLHGDVFIRSKVCCIRIERERNHKARKGTGEIVRYILWSLCLLSLLLPCNVAGHETLTPGDLEAGGIGLEEKTGQILPPDIAFRR